MLRNGAIRIAGIIVPKRSFSCKLISKKGFDRSNSLLVDSIRCSRLALLSFDQQKNTSWYYNGSKVFCSSSAADGSISEEDKIVNEICGNDTVQQKKLRVLMLEKEVIRQEGGRSPEKLTLEQWKELLMLPTRSARRRFLAFLFTVEKKKENRQRKKEENRSGAEQRKQEILEEIEKNEHINYGFLGSTIFIRIYESTMNNLGNNRLIQAMKFNEKLVIDCGFHADMNPIEQKNAAKQLVYLFAENRNADDPFDIHFCNCDLSSLLLKTLRNFMPTMFDPWFPMNVHQNSYLDLFPKEKLVYLTPHCREDMTHYDPDSVYIIGALVDKSNTEPLSLAKAKAEGLKMQRLPLDRYLQWDSGSGKSLTINQMISIMLDIKRTGDWNEALKHVPRRKIVEPVSINDSNFVDQFEKNRRKNQMLFKKKFTQNIDLLLESQIAAVKKKRIIKK